MDLTLEKPQEKLLGNDLQGGSVSSDTSDTSSHSVSEQYPCVSCIDDTILPPQRKLPKGDTKKLTKTALVLATVTLITTIIMTAIGFFTSQESNSSAMFGFAFDSFFGMVSSCILMWRFYNAETKDSYTIAKRETHSTVVVAICMIVSSIAIFIRAIDSLYHFKRVSKSVDLLIFAGVCLLVYSVLFLSKYKIANKLGSAALLTDAMDSFWGAAFSLSILVCDFIAKYISKVWFLDSTLAIIVAVLSLLYGSIVLEKMVRLFSKREEHALKEYQKELMALEELSDNEK